jgi:hypothetical protein
LSFKIVLDKDVESLVGFFAYSNAVEVNMSTLGELPKLQSILGMFMSSQVQEVTIKNVTFPSLYNLQRVFASPKLVKIDWENVKFSTDNELILTEFCRDA